MLWRYWFWLVYRWIPRRCGITAYYHGRCRNWVWREPWWRHGACDECLPF